FKDHPDIPPEDIRRRLLAMQPAPTFLVASGHGIHPFWRLRQREDASDEGGGQARLEEVLKLACAHIGGDPHVTAVARLMRLPGSHNSRGKTPDGEQEWLPVEVIHHAPDVAYWLEELTEAFLLAAPILPASKKGEEAAESGMNGHAFEGAKEWTGIEPEA